MRHLSGRFLLQFFVEEERRRILEGGPWFFGKATFAVAEYDGLQDIAEVPIATFPVTVEIFGLPPKLLTEEAIAFIGATLGSEGKVSKASLNEGRARVRVQHQILARVQSVLPPQVFDFAGFEARVRFKYEKLWGFCRTCRFFEHVDDKCSGAPPDSSSAPASLHEAVHVPVITQFTSNLGPMQGGGPSSTGPGMFTIPGMSVSEVEAMATKFRSPGSTSMVSSMYLPQTNETVVHNPITGVKRQAQESLITYAKRGKVVTKTPVSAIQFEGDLALKNINGVLVVSPRKKAKRGRPTGSTNKPKLDVAPSQREKIVKVKRARRKTAKALEVAISVEVNDSGQQLEIAVDVGLWNSNATEGSTNAGVGATPQHE